VASALQASHPGIAAFSIACRNLSTAVLAIVVSSS
jgi:hypothetical protein